MGRKQAESRGPAAAAAAGGVLNVETVVCLDISTYLGRALAAVAAVHVVSGDISGNFLQSSSPGDNKVVLGPVPRRWRVPANISHSIFGKLWPLY